MLDDAWTPEQPPLQYRGFTTLQLPGSWANEGPPALSSYLIAEQEAKERKKSGRRNAMEIFMDYSASVRSYDVVLLGS